MGPVVPHAQTKQTGGLFVFNGSAVVRFYPVARFLAAVKAVQRFLIFFGIYTVSCFLIIFILLLLLTVLF
jgi:hypothetical protein